MHTPQKKNTYLFANVYMKIIYIMNQQKKKSFFHRFHRFSYFIHLYKLYICTYIYWQNEKSLVSNIFITANDTSFLAWKIHLFYATIFMLVYAHILYYILYHISFSLYQNICVIHSVYIYNTEFWIFFRFTSTKVMLIEKRIYIYVFMKIKV